MVWSRSRSNEVTEMVPIGAISSIAAGKTGAGKWRLVIVANGKPIEFVVDKNTAQSASQMLEELVAAQPVPLTNNPPASGRGSLAEDLISLKWRLDNGMISESEFDEQRMRLFHG
jgi:hypothetical protein